MNRLIKKQRFNLPESHSPFVIAGNEMFAIVRKAHGYELTVVRFNFVAQLPALSVEYGD